jgi:eukaryotic-like serine/threonine-protein kinase
MAGRRSRDGQPSLGGLLAGYSQEMDSGEPGRLLAGRYRLRSVIGRGGMGVVWAAADELLGRDVAVKEILWPPQLDAGERETLRQRALREARTAARLNHPNIVGVYDVVEDDGRPWIVMRLVPCPSLSDVVRDEGPLSPGRAAQIGVQVLTALRAAHAIGVLHRDVKPGNVLLGPGDQVVLTDFGVAVASGSPTLTTSGVVIGSPSYIAPERVRGEPVTPAADLWALGATLYAAVEGRPPFNRGEMLAVLTAVVNDDPDPPTRAGPLRPVIEGLLRKDPLARLGAAEADRMLRHIAGRGAQPAVQAAAWPAAPERAQGLAKGAAASALPEEPTSPLPSTARGHVLAQQSKPPQTAAITQPRVTGIDLRPDLLPLRETRPGVHAREPLEREAMEGEPPEGELAEREPTAPGFPGPDGPLRRPQRRPWLIAALAAAIVVIAAVIGIASLSGPGHRAAAPATRKAPPTHSAAQPGTSAPGAASSGPGSAPSASGGGSGTLPAGFTRYRDPTGFSIGMPAGWQVSHEGHLVYIRDPDGGRFLLIDQSNHPQPDPLADWRQQEAARISTYPGYHRIRLESVRYPQAERAADWEFTYNLNGQPTHVLNRNVLANADHAYALYWSTPAGEWDASFHIFRDFAATFRPAGTTAGS